jgi:PAS domain S-box-containing protein
MKKLRSVADEGKNKIIMDSEERFRSLVEKSSDVMFVIGQDYTISYVSPSFRIVFKRDPSEMLGKSVLDFFIEYAHQEDREIVKKAFEGCLEKADAERHAEFRLRLLDGTWLYLNAILKNHIKTPTIAGLAVNIRDTTETKRMKGTNDGILVDMTEHKKELANLRRLATVVEDSNDAITIQDFEGNITAWNYGAEQMYGYSKEEALKMNIRSLTPPGKEAEQKEFTSQLMAGKTVPWFETQRVTKDRCIIDVWMVVTKLVDEAGKPIGIATTERDITERRQAEQERKRLNFMLDAKSKGLEQMLYSASHDLRAPLVNIQGYSKELQSDLKMLENIIESEDIPEIIKDKLLALIRKDIPDSLRYIIISTEKMDQLLKGLLRMCRLGRIKLNIEQLDMNTLISSILDTHQFQRKEKGVKVEVGELPVCKGDAGQINQVFSNLLDNALKYIESERPGVIKISGRTEGENAIYCIEDNGIGIAPEYHEKIFDLFYKIDPDRGGEGLGLSIVKTILNMHGGKIWLESVLGKGSKFNVSLPNSIKGGN